MSESNTMDISTKRAMQRKQASEVWEELPTTIIINEDVKEIKAKKLESMQKMKTKGLTR